MITPRYACLRLLMWLTGRRPCSTKFGYELRYESPDRAVSFVLLWMKSHWFPKNLYIASNEHYVPHIHWMMRLPCFILIPCDCEFVLFKKNLNSLIHSVAHFQAQALGCRKLKIFKFDADKNLEKKKNFHGIFRAQQEKSRRSTFQSLQLKYTVGIRVTQKYSWELIR